MTRILKLTAVVCAAVWLTAAPAGAQMPKPEDLTSSVPALDAMHEVIMPMWHDAWPNKDTKALAAMVPDIEKRFAALSKAQLPPLLRDKQAAWVDGVDNMKQAIAAYKAAATAGDNDALLKAAERLHSQYEGLVRVVRPVLKEIEDFHASLYVLYHHQINPFQLAAVTTSVQALQAKMDALNKAALPDRLKGKTDAFNAQRARLAKSLDEVAAALPGKNPAQIRAAIEMMHTQYENLEKVF